MVGASWAEAGWDEYRAALARRFRSITVSSSSSSLVPCRNRQRTLILCSPGFCSREEVVTLAKVGAHHDLRRLFMAEYFQNLAKEGYHFADARPVQHYYHLVFAARHPKGLEFWNKACRIAPDNQRELL